MNRIENRKTPFGYRFAMIHRLQAAIARDDLHALGVTASQLPFLAELFHHKAPMTQEALSTALVIDPAATARTLSQLEKKGLICRKVNPDNRRQKLVTPSPEAVALKQDFYAVLETTSEVLVTGLSPDEREAALDLLDRIMANGRAAKSHIEHP